MECVYARHNRRRLPLFQIETSICRDGDRMIVTKRALTRDAVGHIGDIVRASSLVRKNLLNGRVKLPADFQVDDSSVSFNFIRGVSLDQLLFEAFLDRDAFRFRDIVDDYAELLSKGFKTVDAPLLDERMRKVFGLTSVDELEGLGPYFALTMVDAVFENILVFDNDRFLIDNEWVFEVCLPVSFTLFRSLFYFYKVKYADFDINALVPFDAEMQRHGVDGRISKLFRRMDDGFQSHVFGDRAWCNYVQHYAKQRYSVPVLEQTIAHQRDVIGGMHDQIVHLDDVLRSKDTLIGEKDGLIREKDRILFDLMNSRGWRFVQWATRAFNIACPPGTRRRHLIASLLKLSV